MNNAVILEKLIKALDDRLIKNRNRVDAIRMKMKEALTKDMARLMRTKGEELYKESVLYDLAFYESRFLKEALKDGAIYNAKSYRVAIANQLYSNASRVSNKSSGAFANMAQDFEVEFLAEWHNEVDNIIEFELVKEEEEEQERLALAHQV